MFLAAAKVRRKAYIKDEYMPRPAGRTQKTSRGFTLIELLVVVAIIVVLIAILLPSLAGARRIARTVKCAAQIKAIDLAMSIYASEYNGAILGGPFTTGAFLLQPNHSPAYSELYCPNVNQVNDWSAPAASYMNIQFDPGPYSANRRSRYVTLNTAPALLCPENDIQAPSSTNASFQVPVTNLISYVAAVEFQVKTKSGGQLPQYVDEPGIQFPGYSPNLNLVGNTSNKVFIADGAKFWEANQASQTGQNALPNVDLGFAGADSPGGAYGDWGPFDAFTRSYALPNGITYAMRHGSRNPNAALTSYKFNVGFFDGHVETMNGLTGADPNIWAPSGTVINTSEIDPAKPQVISTYFNGQTSITVP